MFLNLDFERSNHLSGLSYNIHNKELISVKKNEDKSIHVTKKKKKNRTKKRENSEIK